MSKNRKLTLEGTTLDGKKYREVFNSYYLAVVTKNKLTKLGYDVKIVEPDPLLCGETINGQYPKYTKKEKKAFKKLAPPRPKGRRMYRANFK